MQHIAKTLVFLSGIAGQKTAATECGKRVAVLKLAVNHDADCPECRAAVEKADEAMRAVVRSIPEASRTPGMTEVLTSKTTYRSSLAFKDMRQLITEALAQ